MVSVKNDIKFEVKQCVLKQFDCGKDKWTTLKESMKIIRRSKQFNLKNWKKSAKQTDVRRNRKNARETYRRNMSIKKIR